MKRILVLDFDGVCHSYTTPFLAAHMIPDPPVAGLSDFLHDAASHFDICIYGSRSSTKAGRQAMRNWFDKHIPEHPPIRFPESKPPAFITLDDRAITFNGTWPEIPELLAFKPWQKRQ